MIKYLNHVILCYQHYSSTLSGIYCWATSVTVTEANTQQVVPFNEQKGVGFYGSTIVKSAEETLVGSKACQYWYHIMTCVAREVPRRPTLTRLIG